MRNNLSMQVLLGHRQLGLHRLLFAATYLLLILSATSFSAETELAKQTLAEINLARTNPQLFAKYLREFRRQFRGSSYILPGTESLVRTGEGAKGVDEAIHIFSREFARAGASCVPHPDFWTICVIDFAGEFRE
jgi:hypothetical protein